MLDFAKDKKLWDRVRNNEEFKWHREEISELYKEAFKTPPRPHSATDILENNDHGLWRLQFDHLQSSALMALIYPDNEEYYKNLVDSIWAYLNEYTWAPLGHYTEFYYGRTPKDFDYGLLDIFACSVAFALAEIKSLMANRFPKLLNDRISYELKRRTIEPYLTRKFFWESHNNNWTAVCTGAVAGVLMYEAPELFFENQERIHKSMKCYLDSYNDDGICVEGIGYWAFGFGFFASYAMLEKEITNGKVNWFLQPKIKEISKNLQKVFLQKDVTVTYSDSGSTSKYSIGLPQMLRHVYGKDMARLPKSHGTVAVDNTHFNFLLRSVIYHNEDNFCKEMTDNATYSVKGSCYFFKRTENYGFSCKGGNNGESHNHIDVGTFILARHNKQIICDIGAGPYYEGYHTEKRYTFFYPSAYAHNIPIFDGIGEDDIARDDVICDYDEKNQCVSMELANAYGQDFVKSVNRTFTFEDKEIKLKDIFLLDKEVEIKERFISVIEPKIADGVVIIDDTILENTLSLIPQISTKELEYHIGGKYTAYIIDYILPKGKKEFELSFKM